MRWHQGGRQHGELAGQASVLGDAPIIIGRVPDLANVIMPFPQISGAHVRVWTDASTGGVWIEDLQSHNGTCVRKAAAPYSAWVQLHGRQTLAVGDRFYLSDEELALFEIETGE
jgi:FHA domain